MFQNRFSSSQNNLDEPFYELIQQLKPYARTEGFELHEIFLDTAYKQIVIEGQVSFSNNEEIRQFILQSIIEQRAMTNQDFLDFQKINQGNGVFRWPLYERCVELCEQNQIYPSAFAYLKKKPQKPDSIESALPFFTVDVLKSILAKYKLKRAGKRKELEDVIKANLIFDDVKEISRIRFSESYVEWQWKTNRDKFFELRQMIILRAYFLRRLAQNKTDNILSTLGYKLSLTFIFEPNQKLAQLLDGAGYSTVIKNGHIQKLLPLFPSDSAHLSWIDVDKNNSDTM